MTELSPWLVSRARRIPRHQPCHGWLFATASGCTAEPRVVWLSLIRSRQDMRFRSPSSWRCPRTGLVLIAIFWIRCRAYSWLGLYYALYGHRHRVRVGMQTGMVGLGLWSFTMATGHGAG